MAEVDSQLRAGNAVITVESLPIRKRGRPLLIGETLDEEVKAYIREVRNLGGVITSEVTMSAATAIVQKHDRMMLSEYGGPITITKNWAKSLLYRMGFVKRKGCSTVKLSVTNFDELKDQYLMDIKSVVEMEEIPPQLVFNWDQTGISIVRYLYLDLIGQWK